MARVTQSFLLPLLVLLSLVLCFNGVSAIRSEKKIAATWKPIKDLKDAHVQELARFAVDDHNKETKEGLVFDNLYKGETQVVSGIDYRLFIAVKDKEGKKVNYETIVWVKEWLHFKKILKFEKVE